MLCSYCSVDMGTVRKDKKYCSVECRGKANYVIARSNEGSCHFCKNSFIGHKSQKYCSLKCSWDGKADHLVRIQQARRKYPKIDGLNRGQIYRRFNPEKGREELSKDNMKRVILIQALGGCCIKCGYTDDIRALQLDHINGDGYKDRKEKGKSGKVYRYYVNNIDEAKQFLQVLCANCHAIKSIENRDHDSKKAKIYKESLNGYNEMQDAGIKRKR